MNDVLDYLLHLPTLLLWLIFFAENILITTLVLLFGKLGSYTRRDWMICGLTNILNTVVTYAGFWLWKEGIIIITTDISWTIVTDFIILFFAMDLLMFIFHFAIHKTTFLFKTVHQLHHQAVDPTPIDLFILHPVEAIGFGSLWLLLLVLCPFNIYAVMIYLTVNVIFGLAGHLGMEPLPEKVRNLPLLKYLGTSTFHHHHHQDLQHNFGFYTSIWDRIFGTYLY
jgi:sterol desaturase/sphingolipid hydroxylase (fatty acid hydroxylase superfamily)